jgi:hypothetical protein
MAFILFHVAEGKFSATSVWIRRGASDVKLVGDISHSSCHWTCEITQAQREFTQKSRMQGGKCTWDRTAQRMPCASIPPFGAK